ncbi:MAG: hypothetical protein LBJ79_03935 [Endomicrobium sp.]|jgi:hypothetical protein|nr:hypothetical protein [Endomicrobium sp.]
MEDKEIKEKKSFSKWNNWCSPLGLAILIFSCSVSVFFLACTISIIKSVFK